MHTITLRDCATDFVDRDAEKQVVDDFYAGRLGQTKRCLIFYGERDVGTTFFLQHLEQKYKRDLFTVYADCLSSDPEIIFRSFFNSLEQRPLLRWFSLSPWKEVGRFVFHIVGTLISYIPIWGGPAALAIGDTLPQIVFTPYPSVSSERFSRLVTSGRWKKPILFFVDNVQEIKPQSLNILRTAFSDDYDHVRFILCFVDDEPEANQRLNEFERRLAAMGLGVETRAFIPPDDEFLLEFATSVSVTLTDAERLNILRQSRHKISAIVNALAGRGQELVPQLSPIEIELLRYLHIAAQALHDVDLIALVIRSPRLAYSSHDVRDTITKLLSEKWILRSSQHGINYVELASSALPHIRNTLSNIAFDLIAAQELYSYFSDIQRSQSTRHASAAYGALLYKLAKQVDPNALRQRAFDLVRISLGQGDLEAGRQYIQEALTDGVEQSISDLYTLLAFHVSVQEYKEADKILESLTPYREKDRSLEIIHAVVANRLRRHDDANTEIDRLLSAESTEEEWALLTSYKVAGLLHDGRQKEAVAEFETNQHKFRTANNRAYALRNCAAIYFWEPTRNIGRAKEILNEAASIFVQRNDKFGYLTTVNNIGALTTADDNIDPAFIALPAFQEAFNGLSIYGVQHLEEVGANLGICLLLTGQHTKAAIHLTKMIDIASIDFPRALMESALAFIEAMDGDIDVARARMKRVTEQVLDVHLAEAVYQANVNAATLELVAGDELGFDEYVSGASSAGYWGGRDSLDKVIHGREAGAINYKNLPEYFSYDFFQYWSQNPLNIFSPSDLPLEAI